MKYLVLATFFVYMLFLAYLNNAYIAGLPVRSFLVLLCGFLVFLEGLYYYSRLKFLNIIYGLLLVLGVLISAINQVETREVFSGVLRLFQSYLVIVTSFYLLINFGYQLLPKLIIALAIPSALIGFLQGAGVEAAWYLREILGGLQNTEVSQGLSDVFVNVRERPPGLALFAIAQGYFLLVGIAMAMFLYVRAYERDEPAFRWLIVVAILFAGCVASETRSAIAGAVVIIGMVFLKIHFRLTVLVFVIGLLVVPLSYYFSVSGDEKESRVLKLDDASAKGRFTLYKYGLELAVRQPMGYGYGFDSKKMADQYFANERNIFEYGHLEKAQYLVAVHNAVLNVLHVYGVIGLLLLFGFIVYLAKVRWFFAVVLSGVLLNSFFHNMGILFGDLYFDTFIALILYYKYYVNEIWDAELKKVSDSQTFINPPQVFAS